MYFSDQDILAFLDKISERGIIPAVTANSRKAAIIKIFSVLPEERNQLTKDLDIDSLSVRFTNKCSGLKEHSVQTYISRFKTAFAGYLQWIENSLAFSPKPRKRQQGKLPTQSAHDQGQRKTNTSEAVQLPNATISSLGEKIKFSIPIRRGICGVLELPDSLNELEVKRIQEYVNACIKSLFFESDSREMVG